MTLLLLLVACPSTGGESADTSDENIDICAWIADNTPAEVPVEDQVVVYCETSTECSEATRLVTDEATLGAAQDSCESADELNTWERLAAECADDGTDVDAVRCWRLD